MKQTLVRAALVAVGMALVLAVGASAQAGKLSKADRMFIMKAAEGNLLEIRLAEMAFKKGQGEAVKKFAERLVRDHTKAYEELKKVAKKLGVTVPTKLNAKEQNEIEKFAKLKGAQFDKAYAPFMVQEHTTDVAKFKMESKKVQNADLRRWVEQTLPVLEEHLQMARKLKTTGK